MKVAVFGDYMTDRYWIGEANSISAEVPIPVVKIKDVKIFPGGAGNVWQNLEALGLEVRGFCPGRESDFGYPIKNRLMVGDHQIARWDEDDICRPYPGKVFPKVDAVVVADYQKGAITVDIIKKIGLLGGPVFVDTKGDPGRWNGIATVIFPNDKEWSKFELGYASFQGLVVGKQGAKGLTIYKNGQGVIAESPAQARFVRSVNGAGDTVLAAFVYRYLYMPFEKINEDYQEILDFANAAAAIAVENPYTYAPTKDEVLQRYENR